VPEWQRPIPTRNGSRAAGCQALVFDVTLIFKSGVHIKVTQRSRMADIPVIIIIPIIVIRSQQVSVGVGMPWYISSRTKDVIADKEPTLL